MIKFKYLDYKTDHREHSLGHQFQQINSNAKAAFFISFGIACQCYFVFDITYTGLIWWLIPSAILWILRSKLKASALCFGMASLAYGGLGMALAHTLLHPENATPDGAKINAMAHQHMHHGHSIEVIQNAFITFNSSALLHYTLMISLCLIACRACSSMQKVHWSPHSCYWRHHLISVPCMLFGMFLGKEIFTAVTSFISSHIILIQQSNVGIHLAATLGMCLGTIIYYLWLDRIPTKSMIHHIKTSYKNVL